MDTLRESWWKLLGLFLLVTGALCQGQSPQKSIVLTYPADLSTAVRFYWVGDMWSHWRDPMDFYVVADNDKRLHSVLVHPTFQVVGVKAFMTASEMKILIQRLAQADFLWDTSKKVERFSNPWQQPHTVGFEVTVVSSRGTAKGYIRLARMCDKLAQFDATMPTQRIRWQFQTMRWDDGCIIPGYHNEGVPAD